MKPDEPIKALRTYAENAQINNEFDTMRDFDEAAALIETLLAENAELKEAQRWVACSERLPKREAKNENFDEYVVCVMESHFPTSSYDICDAPYDRDYITTALYDYEQKIWHLQRGDMQLNALLDIDDSPLNGYYVTHWQPLPQPPEKG